MDKNKEEANNSLLKLYELCLSKIKETDEISFKLMGLVSFVSGVSIYLLLTQDTIKVDQGIIPVPDYVFIMTGIFGALLTFFIYRWEKRNIQSCNHFRDQAKSFEKAICGEEKNVPGLYKNFPASPKLLGIKFGKTEAEKGIYFITFIFWLLIPFNKVIIQ